YKKVSRHIEDIGERCHQQLQYGQGRNRQPIPEHRGFSESCQSTDRHDKGHEVPEVGCPMMLEQRSFDPAPGGESVALGEWRKADALVVVSENRALASGIVEAGA